MEGLTSSNTCCVLNALIKLSSVHPAQIKTSPKKTNIENLYWRSFLTMQEKKYEYNFLSRELYVALYMKLKIRKIDAATIMEILRNETLMIFRN